MMLSVQLAQELARSTSLFVKSASFYFVVKQTLEVDRQDLFGADFASSDPL